MISLRTSIAVLSSEAVQDTWGSYQMAHSRAAFSAGALLATPSRKLVSKVLRQCNVALTHTWTAMGVPALTHGLQWGFRRSAVLVNT